MRIGTVAAVLLSTAAFAAEPVGGFRGRVSEEGGKPVVGALVSATEQGSARRTTVYTGLDGRYEMPRLPDGEYDLRARRYPYRDGWALAVEDERRIDLVLELEGDPYDRLSQLPANRWFALMLAELPDPAMREEFVRQCTFCHQQGNWATRVPRDREEWEKIFSLMARMGGVLSTETRRALPAVFEAAYHPETSLARLDRQLEKLPLEHPSRLRVVIDEWEVGDKASVQHDIVVAPSGHVYSVDSTKDMLYRLDPETGERRAYPIPSAGLPIGGIFSDQVLPSNASPRVAPHSLQVAPDGRLWVTLCLGNKIGVFDPRKESWRLIDLPSGLYPHTIRFDRKGRAWYTLAVSNHVGMIDPATNEPRTIRLPSRTWTQAISTRLMPVVLALSGWFDPPETVPREAMPPVPYGIDVAPDGGIWFSQLNIERIGRIDPETEEVQVWDTPFPGPRRLRFDSKGNVWVPGFSASVIMRFDPRTKTFRSWELPIEPKGTETPYALNVDRRTDTVWICGTNSDSLIRFEPETERFTVFPLPTRVTYTREIDFGEDGSVWTSNSNTPGWQIETENPQIIRLRVLDPLPLPAQVAAH